MSGTKYCYGLLNAVLAFERLKASRTSWQFVNNNMLIIISEFDVIP